MVLVHYDNDKKLSLACDASPYGLGVVLSHEIDGEDKPIAYASRTLSMAEKAYSHIEKEALSIIFGLKHFHQYLYGRKFEIITDHSPLLKLFGSQSEIPTMAAARIQRWALFLSSFNYDIRYRKGKEHANADTLSRFPRKGYQAVTGDIYKVSYMEELPITSVEIKTATRKDAELGKVINWIKYGWNNNPENGLEPYFSRRDQLSLQDECILWGMRVVIPHKYRKTLLELLHDTHPGINRMKSMARSHIWWPGIDKDIEIYSKNCFSCEQNQRLPPMSTLQSWVWPKKPWERIHVDYGQKGKNYFLIIYDAHSKWIEVLPTSNMTTNTTIKELRYMFARYGLPLELVSDNGPQFIAEEFKRFMKLNGIKHTLVPPYHPSSNGAAERSVQSFKTALYKMDEDEHDSSTLDQKVARYLMVQHTTPHATTGVSPSKLFMAREVRDRWSLLHYDQSITVESNQYKQKFYHDRAHSKETSFEIGDRVLALNKGNGLRWMQGVVQGKQSSKTWFIKTEKGIGTYHSDQLRHKGMGEQEAKIGQQETEELMLDNIERNYTSEKVLMGGMENEEFKFGHEKSILEKNHLELEAQGTEDCEQVKIMDAENEIIGVKETETTGQGRYPKRHRKAPDRLDL